MTATETDTRRAWLLERRQGVGASDVAAIGSVAGAYGSPMSVFADMCGLLPLEDELDGDDVRSFGRDLEPLIAERFQRETLLYVAARQQMIRYPAFERWFATIDGLVYDAANIVNDLGDPGDAVPLGVFESKYTSQPPWDDVPEHYQWQAQWQMMCADQPTTWFAVLHLPFGRPRFRIYQVERDQVLIDYIQIVVSHFWNEHVTTGYPPPADDHPATATTIDQLFGHLATAKVPTLPLDDYRELVDRWTHWRTARLDAEKHEKLAATQIKLTFASEDPDLSEGTIDGELAVSWRSRPDVHFDVKRFRADHPELADEYTTRSRTRVLLPHGKHLK
jgi:predicted phage-related endonuclease